MKTCTIPSPIGFKTGGINCGIKKRSKDLALIYSEVPAVCAGMFTTNRVRAASVKLTKDIISNGTIQAIIANSGNANALTGTQGDHDALEMARITASSLNIDISKVAVASTGSIGKYLPIKNISEGIDRLSTKINQHGLIDAAQAILTTDTHPKIVSKQIELGSKKITITAMGKGAGMIYPHMATMLCFIITDAKITQPLLSEILKNSVNNSFNCISVDGCTSTNDTVIVMANGMADNCTIDTKGEDFNKLNNEFVNITQEIAKMIVTDGEGATKLIQIEVIGAHSVGDAKTIAFSIANYSLLKCSFFGETLGLGRIMAAIGSSSVETDPDFINVYIGNIELVKNGQLCKYPEPEVLQTLKKKKVDFKIELNQGEFKCVVWTSDLSPKYVKINME